MSYYGLNVIYISGDCNNLTTIKKPLLGHPLANMILFKIYCHYDIILKKNCPVHLTPIIVIECIMKALKKKNTLNL